MAGNVWEWVETVTTKTMRVKAADGSAWLEANGGGCARRVVRGGSWFIDPGSSARRPLWLPAGYRIIDVGFRLAQDLAE